jgi:transcriptional regulator with PAS, ATPase and Fis domain
MEFATQILNVHPGSLVPAANVSNPQEIRARRSETERQETLWSKQGLPRIGRFEVRETPVQLGKIATVSVIMQDILAVVSRLARTNVSLTFIGETGTGKDVLAHLLHELSPRAREPFVIFDCSAVPANLVESEIFGHERGAFTGAVAAHTGAFERARGGTLFLDEVGELPIDLQPKLLRVLESRCFRRVGGTRDRPHDVRIVAATNRDLAALVTTRQFREDLYFRLAAAVVSVPPLRDRLEDLPLLVGGLLRELGRGDLVVAKETLELLAAHPWPGNVRELKNTLAAALAFVDGGVLESRQLRIVTPAGGTASALDRVPLGGQKLETIERAAIRQTLRQTRGNKTMAAHQLGIAISTLYEKLRKYDVKEEWAATPGPTHGHGPSDEGETRGL